MPSVQVKNVSDETLAELKRRAALQRRSLQEYLASELEQLARRPDPKEFWASVQRHATAEIDVAQMNEWIREDRASR